MCVDQKNIYHLAHRGVLKTSHQAGSDGFSSLTVTGREGEERKKAQALDYGTLSWVFTVRIS